MPLISEHLSLYSLQQSDITSHRQETACSGHRQARNPKTTKPSLRSLPHFLADSEFAGWKAECREECPSRGSLRFEVDNARRAYGWPGCSASDFDLPSGLPPSGVLPHVRHIKVLPTRPSDYVIKARRASRPPARCLRPPFRCRALYRTKTNWKKTYLRVFRYLNSEYAVIMTCFQTTYCRTAAP